MKHTDAKAVLSCELLRYVRDTRPTEAAFLAWIGGPESVGIYHVLRKAGLVTIESGQLALNPDHLSSDRRHFYFENRRFHIDSDRVDHFAAAPPA